MSRRDDKSCSLCHRLFRVFRPRHVCKKCRLKVCDHCSKSKLRISSDRVKGERICDNCADNYTQGPPSFHLDRSKTVSTSSNENQKEVSQLQQRHWVSFTLVIMLFTLRFFFGPQSVEAFEHTNKSLYLALLCLQKIATFRIYAIGLVLLVLFDEYIARPVDQVPIEIQKETAARDEMIVVDQPPPTSGFSIQELLESLRQSQENAPDIPLDDFIQCSRGVAKLMISLSRATSFAAGAVDNYLQTIESKIASFPPLAPGQVISNQQAYRIQDIIEYELSNGTAKVGGKKNPSICRCIVRLLWFVEFVQVLLRLCYVESASNDTSSGAVQAYEETLGMHHPWVIRKGVISSLKQMPDRATFYVMMSTTQDKEEMPQLIEEMQQKLKTVHTDVKQFFLAKELLEIK